MIEIIKKIEYMTVEDSLAIQLKLKSNNIKYRVYKDPPKEYKSSPYMVWIRFTFCDKISSVKFKCRDEETAILINMLF